LDAPFLRDDFYCSTLAYSITSGILAVGLAQFVYLWSEGISVNHPPFSDVHPSNYVTSLSFSSEIGGRSILAVGRQSGQLTLWSVFDSTVRFELSHPNSISCVTFKPRTTRRNSERFPGLEVDTEELVVGDEMGSVWYYSVEWPVIQNKWSWTGSMTLLAKISAHTQQVCGLAWSPDERYLATGGNDNVCLLFDLQDLIPAPILNRSAYSPAPSSLGSQDAMTFHAFPGLNISNNPGINRGRLRLFNREHIFNQLLPSWAHPPTIKFSAASPVLSNLGTLISGLGKTVVIPPNRQKYRLQHGAAVKAIAFAPWQPTLLATGGGSNDRAIHFFHSRTGVCLATINVLAQVTSLIWSQTRREIAATFGYAQPEHPFRIAVFAWPSCAQVAVIPWGPYGSSWDGHERDIPSYDCGRALWAVGYPGRKSRLSTPAKEDDSSINDETSSSHAPSPGYSMSNRPQPASTSGSQADRSARRDRTTVQPKEKEGGIWCTRTIEEGCIIVASSDQTVKFHEIWTGRRTSIGSASGLFGGSDILETMEGIEKSGSEVIR
jgi:WD40 repeat protein